MRFWFTHSTEVALREQIVQQISLGILSGDLRPGERLPSVRVLARQFGIHPNTVSAAYRQMEAEGWVQLRPGSGVYASPSRPAGRLGPAALEANTLDRLIARLADTAQRLQIDRGELLARLTAALDGHRRFVLLEGDHALARIVLAELTAAGCETPDLCPLPPERFAAELLTCLEGRCPVVMPSKAAAAREVLGTQPLIVLPINSIATNFAAHLPPSREHLVAIASHWPRFLEIAQTMLISAGYAPESLVLRDAREPGWQIGLDQVAAVLCDTVTRAELPPGVQALVFPLLAPSAADLLRP